MRPGTRIAPWRGISQRCSPSRRSSMDATFARARRNINGARGRERTRRLPVLDTLARVRADHGVRRGLAATLVILPTLALAAPGDPDPGFGSGGTVVSATD